MKLKHRKHLLVEIPEHHSWVKGEIKTQVPGFVKNHYNENTTYQNMGYI